MKARDVFCVVICGLGVWFMFQGAFAIFFGVLKILGTPLHSTVSPTEDFLVGGYTALAGLALLLAAEKISFVIFRTSGGDSIGSVATIGPSLSRSTPLTNTMNWLRFLSGLTLIAGFINIGMYFYGRIMLGNTGNAVTFSADAAWVLIGLTGQFTWFSLAELQKKIGDGG